MQIVGHVDNVNSKNNFQTSKKKRTNKENWITDAAFNKMSSSNQVLSRRTHLIMVVTDTNDHFVYAS